jgi:DNA-binding transcriptional regulator LsrR (DeoR family)
MRDSNVRADLSGVLLDPEGHVVETPINDRLITISAAQLRAIPEVIGIAYGLEKVVAARAAIRGGYLDSLVTEKVFAQSLLAN